MARLLADEHFPVQVVYRLRSLGHDVETVREISENKSGDAMSDELVLLLAIQSDRAVLTYNVSDFRRLAAANPGHKGIIACPVDTRTEPKRQARQIDSAIKQRLRDSRLLSGQWIWCDTRL